MTQEAIQKQIEIIQRVSAEVLKSKESSRQFLIDAGIIKAGKKKRRRLRNSIFSWLIINHFKLLGSIVAIGS
ncbi:MAG: hypothetical protein JST39_04145 [Bacteroidetes bacterium]|nr:hypothetical protein [Bacteroidota bacterium]